jgi:hypothetical protein
MEEELLEALNRLGIGPMGLGGKTTCLGVKIAMSPLPYRQPAAGREHPVPFRQTQEVDDLMAEYRLTPR